MRGRAVAAFEQGDNYLDRNTRKSGRTTASSKLDLGEARRSPSAPRTSATTPTARSGARCRCTTPTARRPTTTCSTSTATDWSYWDTDDTRAFVEMQHDFGRRMAAKAAFNYEETEEDTELFYVYGTPDRATGLGLFAISVRLRFHVPRALRRRLRERARSTLFGREHDVVVGGKLGARQRPRNLVVQRRHRHAAAAARTMFDGHYPKPVLNAPSDGSDFDYRPRKPLRHSALEPLPTPSS